MYFHKIHAPTPRKNEKNIDKAADISTQSDDIDFTQKNNNFKSSQRDQNENYSSKIKRSLCRNFTDKGCCPYGEKCQFAHGTSQLRNNMPSNHSYKTRPCFTFINNGYCLYGQRCNFIHQPSSRTPPELDQHQKWQQIYSNFRKDKDMFSKNHQSSLLITLISSQRKTQ